MDRVLCVMRWSRCLVYLDDVISASEALTRLEEVLECLSSFGLQIKAKKCTFMQVAFLGHIVGRSGLACDLVKISAVRAWYVSGSVKQVRKFVGFVGYYRRFIQHFTELCVRMDSGKERCLCEIEVLPVPGPDIGFPHRKRPVCAGYGCWPVLRSGAS